MRICIARFIVVSDGEEDEVYRRGNIDSELKILVNKL